jgi:hypothetical protein
MLNKNRWFLWGKLLLVPSVSGSVAAFPEFLSLSGAFRFE